VSLVALPIDNPVSGDISKLIPAAGGPRAERWFMVHNYLDGVWETAAGLPQIGDQFVDDAGVARDCFAATIEPVSKGVGSGVLNPGDDGYDAANNGWTRVRVQYRSPSGTNGSIGLTTSFTQISAGVSAERINRERDGNGVPAATTSRKIAGGQGVIVQNGELTATLYRYFIGGIPPSFVAQMVALCKPCHTNTAGLSFPRVGGQSSTESAVVGPGQALFKGFGEARVANGNVFEIPLYFGIAGNWLAYDGIETPEGGTSGNNAYVVYPAASLNILVA
jgi:hypothetical protein